VIKSENNRNKPKDINREDGQLMVLH